MGGRWRAPRTHVIDMAVPVQVRVVDVIEVVDAHYIVMEEVGGPELTQLLQRAPGGRLPLHTTRLVFRDLLAGLRHAHGVWKRGTGVLRSAFHQMAVHVNVRRFRPYVIAAPQSQWLSTRHVCPDAGSTKARLFACRQRRVAAGPEYMSSPRIG